MQLDPINFYLKSTRYIRTTTIPYSSVSYPTYSTLEVPRCPFQFLLARVQKFLPSPNFFRPWVSSVRNLPLRWTYWSVSHFLVLFWVSLRVEEYKN